MARFFPLTFVLCTAAVAGSTAADEPTPPVRRTVAQPATRQWCDEIVYVVIVRKFFNGDQTNDVMLKRFGGERERYEGGFWGGDLEGVIQKLDYLDSLGVTTLLLYPVIANDAGLFGKYLATGYRPKNYFKVDENFGDMGTLQRLVRLAHQRRMRIVLDMPLGMPGAEHPFLRDTTKRDWFGPLTPYGVRQWNAEKPEVAAYLIEVSQFWKEQTGCDGFRLDSAHMHSHRFWQEYARTLRKSTQGEDLILLAEVARPPVAIGEFLTATGFTSAYDFSAGTAREMFGKGAGVERLASVLRTGSRHYPSPSWMCAQIDNYESPDFMTAAMEPKQPRMKLALTFLLTLNRVPLLYSGDEAALSYHDVGALFDARRTGSQFLEYTKTLIAARRKHAALRWGDFVELQSRSPVLAYLRSHGGDRVLVILNSSDQAQQVSFPVPHESWFSIGLSDLVTGKVVKPRNMDAPVNIEPWGVPLFQVSQ